jgi:hypothetical protein
MAQTGYTPISIYYSATTTNVPTAGNLVAGELAINTADGKLFYKDSSGVVQTLATKGGVGSSSTTQVLYNSSGLVVGSANMTFNGTTLTLANDASISGLTVGKGASSITSNTVLGANGALGANTTGYSNTVVGRYAAQANTTGNNLIAIGDQALYTNTTGNANIAIGTGSLNANTTGNYNTAVGNGNTGISGGALGLNTTGSNNTALGYQSLINNTTASNNTAVGYQAGYSNTTGQYGTFLGQQAGYTNSVGSYNTFVGYLAGYTSNYNGNAYNTCLGYVSGQNLTTGTINTFLGAGAGQNITTGSKNSIIGNYGGNSGGLDIRTASNYIVLSDGDGNPRGVFDGSGNFMLGSTTYAYPLAVVNTSTTSRVGYFRADTSSYTGAVVILDSPTAAGTSCRLIEGYAGSASLQFRVYNNGNVQNSNNSYGSLSDIKLKENIVDATPKLADLMNVKIRNYNLKNDESKLKQIGVIAQELETVFPSLIDESKDTDKEGNDLGTITKSVKYSVFVPILVKAIQELKAEFDAYKASHP